jgi:hypothetical protein
VKAPELATACAHRDLAPRWDNAADMGKRDKITSYTCADCKETVSTEDAKRLALV